MTTAITDSGYTAGAWKDGSLWFWSVTSPDDLIVDGGVAYTEADATRAMSKALDQEVAHVAQA